MKTSNLTSSVYVSPLISETMFHNLVQPQAKLQSSTFYSLQFSTADEKTEGSGPNVASIIRDQFPLNFLPNRILI
jgi:hypothetical protein